MTEAATSQVFVNLLDQYYQAWFRFHPEEAVQLGVEGYATLLRPYDDNQIGALISLNEKILSSLDELDFGQLSEQQQIDYMLLDNAASLELHELLERDWRYRSPQQYFPFNALHQLLTHPVMNFHAALKSRLEQVPDYLRGARSMLRNHSGTVPASWLKQAIEQGKSGSEFVRSLPHHPVVQKQLQNTNSLQPLADQASSAIDEFTHFLTTELHPQQDDFSCGDTHFETLLLRQHFLDVSAEQLHRFGTELFEQTQQQLLEVCRRIRGDDNVQQCLADIREDCPEYDPDRLLDAYRKGMRAALDFIRQHELVSVPETQALKVIATPEYLRSEIPFAAYEPPSCNDPMQQGYYYVTPPRSEGHMLEHNWTSINITCVHEAFPGHHLQFVTANTRADDSLPRQLHASSTLYEGWAMYCEELMLEQGFLKRPEHEFMVLRDRLWRALRVILDVELHTRGLGVDAAAQRMCKALGFAIDEARADINWYTHMPTVPLGYATGWALIRALREQLSQQPDFDLEAFHDQLLSLGSCALPLVIRHEFGEATWDQVKRHIFK